MANRTAKVASSIVAGMLAGAPLIMPRDVANAAECLAEPGKDGTQGQHWYYRIEHGTKRHCWYLRGQDGKAAQTAPADDSEQAPKAAARNTDDPPHSLQDAHAEYPMPQARGYPVTAPVPGLAPLASTPVAAPPQPDDAQGSSVAARWPSPESAIAPAAAPAPAVPLQGAPLQAAPAQAAPVQAAAAPQATADASDPASATDAAADAATPADTPPPPPAAAPVVPAKPSVSLQMLFAVIGGALALAGLTASVVYRLGRRKERRLATPERRALLWEGVETGPKAPWSAVPVAEEPTTPEHWAPSGAKESVKAQRYEKIGELLEQLVRQGQQSDA